LSRCGTRSAYYVIGFQFGWKRWRSKALDIMYEKATGNLLAMVVCERVLRDLGYTMKLMSMGTPIHSETENNYRSVIFLLYITVK
jgi:hypothetical protein